MVQHIIDNVEVEIKNVHVRIESPDHQFSMGLTLLQLQINTTDSSWENTFVDRVKEDKLEGEPLYKRLKIKDLGFYHIPNDTFHISGVVDKKGIKSKQF